MAEYDAIAEQYRDSKRLPFREVIERRTLFELLGDIRGKTVLDLACGDGFYTRLLKQAGARRRYGRGPLRGDDPTGGTRGAGASAGVQVSAAGRRRVRAGRDRRSRRCHVPVELRPNRRAASWILSSLLRRAAAGGTVRGHQRTMSAILRGEPDCGPNTALSARARFPRKRGTRSCTRSSTRTAADSSSRISTSRPRPTDGPFESAGFRDFQWVDLSLSPDERDNPFWDDFMTNRRSLPFRHRGRKTQGQKRPPPRAGIR